MSKYEKIDFEELGETLKNNVSIEAVHQLYSGGYVNKSGTMSNCPFCYESNRRKLYKTPGNAFICYAGCNDERPIDIFEYYKLKFNVSFFEAKVCLARDFGYIESEIADKLLKGKSSIPYEAKKVINKKKFAPVKKEEAPMQPIDVINNVYNTMAKILPLKEEQYYYLKEIRKLPKERMIKDYFRLPYTKGDAGIAFMNKLLPILKEKYGYEEKDLVGIPGFYRDEAGRMTFAGGRGICMKARKADGTVHGIQIRNYTSIKEDGNLYINDPAYKYLWVTSRDKKDGTTGRAAIDVIIPDGELYTTLLITEGKFKSEIMAKRFSSPVISLPGVKQWKNVLDPEIKYINDNIRKINNIIVCFDADMGTNLDVYEQLEKMTKTVLYKYNDEVKMAVWDQRFGKGLDDVIISNNEDKIKKILCKDYFEKYSDFTKKVVEQYQRKGANVYYKDTKQRVAKEELLSIYTETVLIPLGVAVAV